MWEVIGIFSNVIRQMIADYKADGRKVTQQELADVLGISKQGFSNKMARDSFFIEDVVKIADYLNMKVILKGDHEYIIEQD